MKTRLIAGVIAVMAGQAAAQTPGETSVATRTGHEVSVSAGHYDYIEPGALQISIHGARFGGDYTGTLSLNQRKHWFAKADVRGSAGRVTYDGWCRPFQITPDSHSPNGYALGLGSASPCSETGDPDWYLEARGLVGKDVFSGKWGVSPETGLAIRYLSNGTTGVAGYRTDRYLYLPLGLAVRTRVASHGVVSFKAEYDLLLHGWQTTRESKLGGGDVPATPTAPAFTIDSFTDLSFAQHRGWAVRVGAKYQVTKRWSVEPSYVRWSVSASPVRYTTALFTVNQVTAQRQFGAYEPVNVTNELFVSLGFHF